MWRFCICVVALVAAPALAQTVLAQTVLAQALRYSSDEHERREPRGAHMHGRHGRAHRTFGLVEPSRQGPAPVGFWYRCDLPAGYYPYVPACQMPWRIVPSAPTGSFR
jgi:hypothetical protein